MRMDATQTEDENHDAFVQRLIEAGWSKEAAEAEWRDIQDDDESGYDGP